MSLVIDLDWNSQSERGRGLVGPDSSLPAGLTGLNIRLDAVTVLDIQRGFLNPRPDADVYPLFMVLAPNAESPIQIPALAVYNDILPGDDLPIAKVAAPTVFRTGATLPDWIDVHVVLMKSRERQRELAGGIHEALESTEGKTITSSLVTLLTGANPFAGTVAGLGVELLKVVSEHLSKSRDTQLFYAHASIERADRYCLDQSIVLTDDRHARFDLRVQARFGESPA